MNLSLFRKQSRYAVAALLLTGMTACQPLQKGLDAEDDRNPYFRRATKLVSEQNFHGAINEYENALRANPEVGQAHVEMGLLYLDKLGDPISSIYHFQKYLNMRPNAANREQLQTYIDKAKIDFAITLPNSTAQNAEEFARLKKENIELRQSLAQAQSSLATTRDQLSQSAATLPETTISEVTAPVKDDATATTPAPKAEAVMLPSPIATAPSQEPSTKSHVISKGDSLWKIASKYYPENIPEGVKKIQEANPEKASNPSNLKLGNTLIIP